MPANRQKLPIRFWRGLNIEHVIHELSDIDKKQLARLLAGDYNLLSLEKLRGSMIYSIRVNSGRRILFTTLEVGGKKIALILAVLPNHDYAGAWCLKPQVLKQFLIKQDDKIEELEFESIETIEGLYNEVKMTPDEPIDLNAIPCDYYAGKAIVLTDEQQNIQLELKLPCFIQGMAGSGKTSVVNAIIIDHIALHVANNTLPALPIVYVTKSASLVDLQRRQWEAHPLSQTEAGQFVLFLTSKQAIAQFSPAQEQKLTPIKSNELSNRIVALLQKLSRGEFKTKGSLKKIRHEFEIIAAYNQEEKYYALGENQSNYVDRQDRQLFWRAYSQLKDDLLVDHLYAPSLYRFQTKEQFELVIVDEAHTGSRVVKLNLRKMCKKFIGCVDSLQSMNKNISDVPYLIEQLGNGKNIPAKLYPLSTGFRNPLTVLACVQNLNEMRRFVHGGKADATELTQFTNASINATNVGVVRYFESTQTNELFSMINTERADVAIITTKKRLNAAKQKFNNPQVFTTVESGGLEFDNIIVEAEIFDENILMKIVDILNNYKPGNKANKNKPKKQSEHVDALELFNRINTAFTRAKKRLFVVGTTPKNNTRIFYQHLKTIFNQATENYHSKTETSENTTAASSEADWEEKISHYLLTHKIELAKEIWVTRLNRDESAFYEHYHIKRQRVVINTKKPSRAKAQRRIAPPLDLSKYNLNKQTMSREYLSFWTTQINGMTLFEYFYLNEERHSTLTEVFCAQKKKFFDILDAHFVLWTTQNRMVTEGPFSVWLTNTDQKIAFLESINDDESLFDCIYNICKNEESALKSLVSSQFSDYLIPGYLHLFFYFPQIIFDYHHDYGLEYCQTILRSWWFFKLHRNKPEKNSVETFFHYFLTEQATLRTTSDDLAYVEYRVILPRDIFYNSEQADANPFIDDILINPVSDAIEINFIRYQFMQAYEASDNTAFDNHYLYQVIERSGSPTMSRLACLLAKVETFFDLLRLYVDSESFNEDKLIEALEGPCPNSSFTYLLLENKYRSHPTQITLLLYVLESSKNGVKLLLHLLNKRPGVINRLNINAWGLTPDCGDYENRDHIERLFHAILDKSENTELKENINLYFLRAKKKRDDRLLSLLKDKNIGLITKIRKSKNPSELLIISVDKDNNLANAIFKEAKYKEYINTISNSNPEIINELFHHYDFSILITDNDQQYSIFEYLTRDCKDSIINYYLMLTLLENLKGDMLEVNQKGINALLVNRPYIRGDLQFSSFMQYAFITSNDIFSLIFNNNPSLLHPENIHFLFDEYVAQDEAHQVKEDAPLSIIEFYFHQLIRDKSRNEKDIKDFTTILIKNQEIIYKHCKIASWLKSYTAEVTADEKFNFSLYNSFTAKFIKEKSNNEVSKFVTAFENVTLIRHLFQSSQGDFIYQCLANKLQSDENGLNALHHHYQTRQAVVSTIGLFSQNNNHHDSSQESTIIKRNLKNA